MVTTLENRDFAEESLQPVYFAGRQRSVVAATREDHMEQLLRHSFDTSVESG